MDPVARVAPGIHVAIRSQKIFLQFTAARYTSRFLLVHGSTIFNPAALNGEVSRVATVLPLATAVAAMQPADIGIVRPSERAISVNSA